MKIKLLFVAAGVIFCSAFAFAQNGSAALPPKSMFVSAAIAAGSPPSPDRPDLQSMFDQQTFEKKSVFKAVGLSLLLPGMGELYAGEYDGGKYFTMVEGGLWLGFAGFTSYATWTQNDARAFATQHAGAPTSEQSDQYYIDIGDFVSADAFNVEILRERQNLKTYDTRSTLNWQWDTDENREKYRGMRVQADESFNYARFAIAAVITNHIVSAINAGRLVIRHNASAPEASRLQWYADVNAPAGVPDGVKLSFVRTF